MIKKESALKYAIDQYWKILQKKDNWFIVNENIGYQAAGYSDIEKIDVDYTSYLN